MHQLKILQHALDDARHGSVSSNIILRSKLARVRGTGYIAAYKVTGGPWRPTLASAIDAYEVIMQYRSSHTAKPVL